MNTPHTPVQPDSRLPWRAKRGDNDFWEVWTHFDSTTGSRNNYCLADGIQDEDQAILLASAPTLLSQRNELREALSDILRVIDSDYDFTIPATMLDAARAALNSLKA